MFIIGLFIMVLSFLLDDVSTYVIFITHLGILESNPLYRELGLFSFIAITIGFWLLIIGSWYWVCKKYKELWQNLDRDRKYYDVVVYFMCLIIILAGTVKISAGISNIGLLASYAFVDERKIMIDEYIPKITEMSKENPAKYNLVMDNEYNQILRFSYLQVVIISLLAYMLMKVGSRIHPWGYSD